MKINNKIFFSIAATSLAFSLTAGALVDLPGDGYEGIPRVSTLIFGDSAGPDGTRAALTRFSLHETFADEIVSAALVFTGFDGSTVAEQDIPTVLSTPGEDSSSTSAAFNSLEFASFTVEVLWDHDGNPSTEPVLRSATTDYEVDAVAAVFLEELGCDASNSTPVARNELVSLTAGSCYSYNKTRSSMRFGLWGGADINIEVENIDKTYAAAPLKVGVGPSGWNELEIPSGTVFFKPNASRNVKVSDW